MVALNGFRSVIIGAPASGKGTISSRIVKKFNLKHISSGDILRQNIEKATPLGIEARKYTDNGQLVPDNMMIKCIFNELKECGKFWMLDGFPRTVEQAKKLWDVQKLDAVINLVVPYETIIERVNGRWIHLKSGRVYNIGFNEPKIPFKDDITGDALEQRQDDRPEAVRERLKIYDSLTKPVIQYYKEKNILTEFKGNATNIIWPEIEKFLDSKFLK